MYNKKVDNFIVIYSEIINLSRLKHCHSLRNNESWPTEYQYLIHVVTNYLKLLGQRRTAFSMHLHFRTGCFQIHAHVSKKVILVLPKSLMLTFYEDSPWSRTLHCMHFFQVAWQVYSTKGKYCEFFFSVILIKEQGKS